MATPSLPQPESFHLTKISGNRKTGPIPVSTSSAATCPESCPLRAACYARFGPLSLHWSQVTFGQRGYSFEKFLEEIRSLPDGQLWRHNEAGDLPGEGDQIDVSKLRALVQANRGKRGFTYTHKPVLDNPQNAVAIKCANQNGFTVNLSADSIEQADQLVSLGIGPVATVLPEDTRKNSHTPAGNGLIVCPNTINKKMTCSICGLCQRHRRSFIIGFPLHGPGKRQFEII